MFANLPERYGTPDLVALTITELFPDGGFMELLAYATRVTSLTYMPAVGLLRTNVGSAGAAAAVIPPGIRVSGIDEIAKAITAIMLMIFLLSFITNTTLYLIIFYKIYSMFKTYFSNILKIILTQDQHFVNKFAAFLFSSKKISLNLFNIAITAKPPDP